MINKNNNPWLGLSSYQTSDAFRFFGREREMEEISASIKDNYCTVLYGVSGAGKTSIINAGLCPKLSGEGYLPITIRLNHNGTAYSRQVVNACFNTFEQTGTEYECPVEIENIGEFDERDTLWLFFHAATFWSKDNRKVVPVLFIDQFEEIFTLTKSEEQVLSFFQQVDSLFGSVPSERLIAHLESSDISFDFSETPRFRMVLSMREDFLARLEDYCYNLPILRRNRIGLRKMNGLQALDVIMKPQSGLVAEDVALKIVSAVTGKDCSANRTRLQMLAVDTSILSLFCSELYQLSFDKKANVITSDIVDTEGGDIIKRFYEKNVSKLSRRGRRYLEQHLLTSGGFRNQLAVEDINHSLVKDSDIHALETSRIIRKEIINGTERIEFTHDILCKAAMESMRKTKDKSIKRSSIMSYGAFALVCLYIAQYIVNLVVGNFGVLRGRAIYTTLIEYELSHLFKLFYGLLFLPLCIPYGRKKSWVADIILIIIGIVSLSDYYYSINSHLFYYSINGNVSRILRWHGWAVLLTIIPILNICSRIPRCSFRDYRRSIFRPSLLKMDKKAKTIIYVSAFWGLVKIIKDFHYSFLLLPDSKVRVCVACLLTSIITVIFFATVISVIIPGYFKKEKKNSFLMTILVQICVLFIYIISQYYHARWISYVSFVVLLAINLHALRSYLILYCREKKYVRFICGLVSVGLLFVIPNFVSNINILALKNNARAINNRGCCHQAKIVSIDGHYGVMDGSDIIVPPIFRSVFEDYDNSWYYSSGGRYSGFGRISSGINRLLTGKLYNYKVCDDNGIYSSWCVMEHPEIDNKYSRSIPKYEKAYLFNPYITKLAVNYYYQKSVVETKTKYQDDFYIASERLFLINCISEYDKSKLQDGLIAYYKHRDKLDQQNNSDKFLLEYILNGHLQDIRVSGCIPESPVYIYNSLKKIIQSKAIRSDLLLNYVSKLIDSYNDSEHYISKAKCRGLLNLLQGKFSEAINNAKISSDDETLAEALILSGEVDNIELINNITKRTNAEGRFLGENIIKDIAYLANDKNTQEIAFLKNYSLLPKTYVESVSLDLSHVRRTMFNDKVLFIESGKIISEYQKITYPSDKNPDFPGVYFKNGKRGYISWDGHEVTDAKFDHAWIFSKHNGLAVVESKGKIGFINSLGNYTVYPDIAMQDELRYYKDWIFEDDGHLAFPGKERKFGLLDSNGKWIIYPQYGEIGDFNNGFRIFGDCESGKYGLLNRYGKVVIPQKYQMIDVDSKYVEVRDSNYVISYYKHDGNKIIGKVLERE